MSLKDAMKFSSTLSSWRLVHVGYGPERQPKLVHRSRSWFQVPVRQIFSKADGYFWVDHLSSKIWSTEIDLDELAKFIDFYLCTSRKSTSKRSDSVA